MNHSRVVPGLFVLAFISGASACASPASQGASSRPEVAAAPAPEAATPPARAAEADAEAAELEALGSDGFLWGYAIVENYKAIYAYSVNPQSPEYKAPFNKISNVARVYTPADKAIVTPNSDTPYSSLVLDLRAEPQVLSVPAVERNRYYSLQFVDGYTHNFAYVGTRATGNKAGRYLVAGPSFKGEKPAGIDRMIQSETDFVFVVYRTQLFNQRDIEGVKRVQAGYLVTPFHEFAKTAAPPAAPVPSFPVWDSQAVKGPGFFVILDFLLDFMPVHPEDAAIRKRLMSIGVGAPGKFDDSALTDKQRAALLAGLQKGEKHLAELAKGMNFIGRPVTAGDLFGTRAFLAGDWRRRNVGALLGIYGNSREEALYPFYTTDDAGKPLDASQARYTMRFEKGKLPPSKAFWSVTMYDARTQLLVENPLKRYLINSSMLPSLEKDPDGSTTLTLSNASPGKGKESNWLPAPNGPFLAVLRIYNPEPAAYDGTWTAPKLVAAPLAAAPPAAAPAPKPAAPASKQAPR
jgi:hypothetical protein